MIEYSKDITWKNGEKKLPLFFRFFEKKAGSNALVVYLHGAAGSSMFPYYNGMSIAKKYSKHAAHFLLVSDPLLSLADELRVAWYTSPYQEEAIIINIASEINNIVSKRGVEKILFVGGSAASIPLIKIGRYVKNSYFFIWNPQTDLTKYYVGHISRWASNLKVDETLLADLSSKESTRTSVNFKECFEEKSNYYSILQMFKDDFHLKNHAKPFYEAMTGKPALFHPKLSELVLPNVLFHIGSWERPIITKDGLVKGHIPPRSNRHAEVILAFVKHNDPKRVLTAKFFRKWDV